MVRPRVVKTLLWFDYLQLLPLSTLGDSSGTGFYLVLGFIMKSFSFHIELQPPTRTHAYKSSHVGVQAFYKRVRANAEEGGGGVKAK